MGSTLSSMFVPAFRGFRHMEHPTVQSFNPLAATATNLQELLSTRKVTSVELVTRSFSQIEKYDNYLKAIITKSPTALKVAQ